MVVFQDQCAFVVETERKVRLIFFEPGLFSAVFLLHSADFLCESMTAESANRALEFA